MSDGYSLNQNRKKDILRVHGAELFISELFVGKGEIIKKKVTNNSLLTVLNMLKLSIKHVSPTCVSGPNITMRVAIKL